MPDPTPPSPASSPSSVATRAIGAVGTPPEEGESRVLTWIRRVLGRTLGISFVLGGVVTSFILLAVLERRPRTDDAYVRANVIGIAAHVSGMIVELPIIDNQAVSKGDVLFVVDPRPYEVALAEAEADLAVVDLEIAALSADVESARKAVAAAQANLVKIEADAVYAVQYLERIEPLLADRFVTPNDVVKARSDADAANAAVAAAAAMVAEREAALAAAIANLGQLGDVNALRTQAEVAVANARLYLDYCTVRSPIDGYITNLNITRGEYANEGVQVFAIVDRSIWYVMANFKETDLPYFDVGAKVEVYRMSDASDRLEGYVEGIGWALYQEDGATVGVLPDVAPTLDWVRLAQRFPVRIVVTSEPERPLRMGETMSVIMVPPGDEMPPPRFPMIREFFDRIGLDY